MFKIGDLIQVKSLTSHHYYITLPNTRWKIIGMADDQIKVYREGNVECWLYAIDAKLYKPTELTGLAKFVKLQEELSSSITGGNTNG